VAEYQVPESRLETACRENALPIEQLSSGSLYPQVVHSDTKVALDREIHLESHYDC
jgi:hypothetical protein